MKLPFARRVAPSARLEPRLAPAAPAPMEHRDASGFALGAGFVGSVGMAEGMSASIAEGVAAVAACVGALSSGIASLPLRAYRTTPGGRVELTAREHWLPALLESPSPRCTYPEFCEELIASTVLHGNGLATINYDSDGQPTELNLVPWPYCTPVITDKQQLAFNVSSSYGPFINQQAFKRYLASECIYLKDRSDNGGWTGRARISRSPGVIAAALGVQEYSAAVWRNSASPAGIIQHPFKLNAEARKFLSEQYKQTYEGAHNARRTIVLDEGMTWANASVSPMDAETLESRRHSVPEICRLFQVPPAIVQSLENNAFSSAEQANKWFAQISLAPWCRKLEAAIGKSLLGDEPDLHVQVDMSALVRGDYTSRWSAHAIAIQNKILSRAEVRDEEGYGPMPGELVGQ